MSFQLRLRQSHSGYLLGRDGRTLAELRRVLEHGRAPSKAMEDGALVDQILYGGHSYCEVQPCAKRSGPDKGKVFDPDDWTSADAQEQRKAARSRGQVCVLKHEVDAALEQAESYRQALLAEGIDMYNGVHRIMGEPMSGPPEPGIYTQPRLLWRSHDGVNCESTPDILQVLPNRHWRLVDTKLSARSDADWCATQAAKMGWDVQSGAYIEACSMALGLLPAEFDGYGLLLCEKRSGLHMAAVHWLDETFLHCGATLWQTCKDRWKEAVENDAWPGVLGSQLSPPGYHVHRIFGDDRQSEAEDLSSIGLDLSDLETEE